ncbi:MAG TPA: type I DNA topoisomerase [Candidatus Rhabdochlamydia sp.]|jgi:DNA topoisomerase I|nr:type I DNA topoisomerase [Candidatus Rhabdochlamydia sp.]
MTKALIIVESPAKIKTLKKFLGSNYLFESSLGHIRDLPQKGFGIDVENDFEPQYTIMPDKKDVIDRLKKAAKQVSIVYLSPDPDREGEAIAWHIASILPKGTTFKRVTFNAITKEAVSEALKHPRQIDQGLVDAQQARRLLDRIVGYKISPILMRRVQGARDGGLSAGRVQSVALKLVVDREKEIEVFIPVEYWNIQSILQTDKNSALIYASLYAIDGKKVEKEAVPGKDYILINQEEEAHKIVAQLQNSSYKVESVERKERKRNPVPPFITSTLQQEASRHFGFSASRTMNIAQGLYEGIDLGNTGAEGLITYMRTDSVRIAPEAIDLARKYITKVYGKEFLPDQGKQYSSKKNAQDAHEAIRPTSLQYSPEEIKSYLTTDQYKLYLLIWRRFLASQMNPAIYDTVSCDIITNQNMLLRATGSTLKFSGFLVVYEEKKDVSEKEEQQEDEKMLPSLVEGQPLLLLDVDAQQAFTRPPPRFTEASLVKELEKSGIGRPSTYATIMNKIQSRDYTVKEKGSLKPTELGRVIAQMLEENFKMIMDVGFTSAMEDELEEIAYNHKNWKVLLHDFWERFIPFVVAAEKEAFVPRVATDIDCPNCGHKLEKIWARNKYFYGCSNYPVCDFTTPLEALNFNKEDYDPNFNWDQLCPKCGSAMKIRYGRFGTFLGCSRYPECKGIVNIPKKDEIPAQDLPTCPALGCDGKMVQRRSRFGKPFFSCSNYPDCNVIINNLDQLTEKYVDHPKTPYVSKKPKKGKKGSTKTKKTDKKPVKKPAKNAHLYTLSLELQAIVKEEKLSRPEVVKKIWEYIKKHNCQDKKNKRLIIPDVKLAKVFGSKEPIDMLKLAGLLTPHLL